MKVKPSNDFYSHSNKTQFQAASRFESESFWNIAGHFSAPGSFLFLKWPIFAFVQISVGVNPKYIEVFVQKTKFCIISVEILPIFFILMLATPILFRFFNSMPG